MFTLFVIHSDKIGSNNTVSPFSTPRCRIESSPYETFTILKWMSCFDNKKSAFYTQKKDYDNQNK
ncbi:hypothetical protein BpHYR1_044975 [Brachionus plicatilis]|uniref:Uncharacterized protein n=1 Tax=Brachionus plicatilis TaxID=10195 RepID=A0A3M7Q6X2_BRAPC|nr:hypothetical protein BpHYR1_044975 [Brachionus plicatilis]